MTTATCGSHHNKIFCLAQLTLCSYTGAVIYTAVHVATGNSIKSIEAVARRWSANLSVMSLRVRWLVVLSVYLVGVRVCIM